MKKILQKKNNIVVLLCFMTLTIYGQLSSPKDAFLEKWTHSKDYLIAIAESMPEENYMYKPTAKQMNFGEQLLHIRQNMIWLGSTYFSEKEYDKITASQVTLDTKKAILEAIQLSFDMIATIVEATPSEDLSTTVNFFAGPKSKLQILNLLQDHVTHHRGQLIVYLNLNKIKPPTYSGW